MNTLDNLRNELTTAFPDAELISAFDQLTMTVANDVLIDTSTILRDQFGFEQMVDLAGVDYLGFGTDEWNTDTAEGAGFSRGVNPATAGHFSFNEAPDSLTMDGPRFAVVYHLLSVKHNYRLRVKAFCKDNDFPVMDSVVDIWNCANWYEREAFDLFGIAFDGHPDLRRILTDYGFVGHAFRKDFPLIGHVEMRYDEETKRVIYQPVSIEPRVLVPKVKRDDNRYVEDAPEQASSEAEGSAE